jgi:hypothetical protein
MEGVALASKHLSQVRLEVVEILFSLLFGMLLMNKSLKYINSNLHEIQICIISSLMVERK